MAITKEQVEKKFIDSGVALGKKYATGKYLENRKLTTKVTSPAEVIAYTMTTLQNDGADVDLVIDDKEKEWRIDYKYSDGSKDSISGPIIVTEAGTTTKKKVENTVVFRELNGMPVEVPVSVAEAKKTADMIKTIKKTDDFKGAKRTSWVQTQARKQIQRFQQPKTRSEAIEAKKEGQLSSDYVNAKRAYQQNIGPYVDELAKKIESKAKKQGKEAGWITTEIYGLLGRIVSAESESAAQAVANSILNSPDAEYVELSKIKGALQLVVKDAMLLKKSGYRFSYNTISENSASTMKVSAVQARKIVDPIGLSPEFVRRQHDPAEMRIPSNKWKQQQKKSGRQMFHRNPIIASEAWGVLRPGRESPELLSRGNKVIPYDALVLGAEVTEEEAHRIGKSVREGASVAAEDFMEVVSTVRQEFEKEFSEKFAYRVAEKEYKQRTKGRRGKKRPPAFKDISEDEKNRYIKDALIRTLKDKYKINIDNATIDYNDIEGQYIASGVGTKYAKDAQRLTSMYGIRSAANKATSEQISSIVGQRNGQNVTFIKEKEGINARNIGTHASQDIQTLFVRAAESADGLKGLMDRIDSFVKNGTYKYADNSVVDFSEIAKIFQDFFKLSKGGSYVITEGLLLDKLQNATDPEIFSKLLLFTDVLQNPTADTQFYAPRLGDDGRLNVARTNNRRYFYDALSATNQFYYGAYDKYGAVSMTSGADSIDRLAAIAGLSESDAKKISDLLRPSEEEQAELEELRKRDAEARRRTYQTAEKDFDSSKLIGDEDYVIIGRGSGDNIIDISTIQRAVRDENGKITNESEMLVGRLKEYIEKKFGNLSDEERKEKLDKLQIVIDLGDNLGETTTYVDERGNSKTYFAGGTHAFLRQGFSSNKNIFDNAQQLINTLNIEGVNKKYLNEQFIEFLASMSNDVNYKEGRSYQEVWKQKQPRSMYGAAASFSTKDILSDKEYESASKSEKLISDIASYGAAISANTAKEMLEDGDAFKIEQLRDMLDRFSGKDFKKTIKDKNGKFKRVKLNRAETIQEILKYLTIGSDEFNDAASRRVLGEGLSAFIGRLPFMNGLDIKALGNLFIDPSFKDSGLKLSVGLSKLMNADFDGDKIAAALIALSDMGDTPEDIEAFKKNFSKLTATSKAIAGKMAKITKQAEEQEEDLGFSAKESGNLRKELEMAATIASRVDKGKTGIFSNYASEIRERMKNAGIDETGGIRDETSALRAVRAMLTRGLLETNEQNVISSKKTILRMAKIQAGGKELTSEDEINKYYSMAINEISKFNEQWRTGKLTLSEFLDKLTELGVTGSGKDGESFIEGRVMQQIMLAAEEMVDKVSGGDKEKAKNLWHQMFGENVRRYDELGDSEKYLYGQGLTRDIFEKSFSAVADQLGTTADDLLKEAIWHANTPEKRRVDPESESAAYHLTRDEQGKTHYVDASALKPEFYQMVEKSAKRAKKAVDEERIAEEQKVVVAGKEAKAILGASKAYGTLSDQLEDVKDAYEKFGTGMSYGATAHDVASLLNPSSYTVVDGKTIGRNALASQISQITGAKSDQELFQASKAGKEEYIQELRTATDQLNAGKLVRLEDGTIVSRDELEKGLSGADLLKYRNSLVRNAKKNAEENLGFKGTIKEFRDKRESFIHTQEGTYIHELNELSRAKEKGEDSSVIEAEADKQAALLGEQMRVLGFAESEITKRLEKAKKASSELYKETKAFGNVDFMEAKLTSLKKGSQGFVHGAADAITIDDDGAIRVIDWKTGQKSITDENKAQVAVYQAMLEGYRGRLKEIYKEQDLGIWEQRNKDGDETYVNSVIKQFMDEDIGKELKTRFGEDGEAILKKLLLAGGGRTGANGQRVWDQKIKGGILLSNSQGISKWLGEGLSPVLAEKLLYSPESLTRDEKAILYAGGTYVPAGSSTGKRGKGKSSGGSSSAGGSSEKENSLKSEYIKLLKEQYDLMIKIDALEHKRDEMLGRGEDVTAVNKDIDVLKSALGQQEELLSDKRFKKTAKDKDVLDYISTQEHRVSYQKSLLGVGDAEDVLKAFERYATKRMKLESEIEQAQLKASTTVGNERKAWENVVALKQQSLKASEDTYEILKKQAVGVDKNRAQEIIDAVDQQKAILSAQKFAGNRGNRTIFDVIKSDIQRATMRITDFGLAARVLNTARKEIQQVYQNILKLNEAMTNLRIVTGSNTEQAKSMMNTYNDLAMQLGTTTQAVAQSAAEWLRQGYSVSEANELIKSSTYLSRLGFMDMGQSVTALTSVMKGFRIEATNSMDIVDKLTQLDAKYATTAGDIATALSRTSAVAREAGLNLDQAAAALTTMIDVSQQDASSVGNAFRTILARYGNVKATAFTSLVGDSEDIDDANGSINDTEKVLGAIGIKIRSSSSDMRDFDDVMDELADKWVTLTDVEKNAVSTALAGVRQRNIFGIYMENYDTYKQAISEAEKAEGTAARKMQAYNESVAYSINQLSAAWEGFAQKLEASGAVKLFFQLLTVSVENFGRILSQVASTIVSLRSFKLTTDLKRLADFFGFGASDGKGRLKTKWDKTKAWFSPNRMAQQAAQEKEKYEQQRTDTSEKRSRNEIVNSNNKVVDALNRNADALDRNSNAQNAKQVAQSAASMPTPNTPPVKSWATEYGTLNGKYVFKTVDGKWKYGNRHNIDDASIANIKSIASPAGMPNVSTTGPANEQEPKDPARFWLAGLSGSTIVSGGGPFGIRASAAKKALFIDKQIKDLQNGPAAYGNEDLTRDRIAQLKKQRNNIYKKYRFSENEDLNQIIQDRNLRVKELKANWKQGAIRGIGTGLTAGVISGMSAEGDLQDKVVAGASTAITTGLISAIPGVGTILGPILGPVLGGFFGKEINKLLKADEVARKERVEDAKKQLEAIKGISTAVTGLIDIRKKGDTSLWDADDWKQANEYVESLEKARNSSVGFQDALNDAVKGLGNYTLTIEKLTENQETLAKVEAARIKYEAEQTYAAGEQDRYTLLKEIEEAQKKLTSDDEDERKQAQALIKANKAAIQEYTDELNKAYMKSAFYSSGVSTMSQAQKNTASLERLIVEMAEEAERAAEGKTDEKFFEDDGTLKSEYRSKFIQQIREQGGYEAVLTESEKSVADYKRAINTVAGLTDKNGKKLNMKLSDLKKLVSSKGGIAELGDMLEKTGDELDRIVDQINSADDSKIATIAHSLNMTVEEFNEANRNGDFDFFTTGMAVENLDAFIDRIDKLNGYLAELATNGKLSAESLESIVKNYAFLMQGANGSFGAGNILDNLAELYAEGSESTIAQALAGKFQKKAVTDEAWWNAWTQSDRGKAFVNDENRPLNTTFTSFSDAMPSMTPEEQQSYIEYVKSLFTTDLNEEIQEKLIEWQTKAYETEISNLESIRDSLDDVNKQREKELELIKAKEALENASKEKKRVYRAGVGFVYTTDQEAVKSAQDKVDELERQQDKDNIQYQIDSLQQQKEILENLENNKQLENLTTFVEKIQKALGEDGNNLFNSILTENGEFRTNMVETIADGIIRSAAKVKEQENLEATKEAAKEYVKAGQEYDKFMSENGKILKDQNNPAYASTYEEYQKKLGALEDARSRYNEAAKLQPLKGTYSNKEKYDETGKVDGFDSDKINRWNETDDESSGEKVGSQVNVFDDSFDWKTVGEAAAGAAAGGLIVGGPGYAASAGLIAAGVGAASQLGKAITGADVYISEESPEATGESFTKHMVGKNRSKKDKYIIGHYDSKNKKWIFESFYGDIDNAKKEMQPYDILINDWNNAFYKDRAVFMDSNKKFRWVNADEGVLYANNWEEDLDVRAGSSGGKFASGTLSAPGGRSLINENGLESIITPSGTITSLPAKSGIIPADLTRNLWTLGEVAPNLIARLGGNSLQTNNSNSSTDNSINIQNLDATFNTQSDFDGHRFLTDLRNQVILTANNH